MLAAPEEVGGLELSLPDLMSSSSVWGRLDPTVAWQAMSSFPPDWSGLRLPDDDRSSVFATTDAPFGYRADRRRGDGYPVPGGYRLTGRWPFMTGAADAAWATWSWLSPPPAEPGDRPTCAGWWCPWPTCTCIHLGRAVGMRGTGSDAVSAEGVSCPIPSLGPRRPAPLRPPPVPGQTLGCSPPCAAMAVGVLCSGIAGVVDMVAGKVSRFDGHTHAEDPRLQQVLADATAAAECLSAGLSAPLWTGTGRPWWRGGARRGRRIRLWSTMFWTFDVAAEHASRLFTSGWQRHLRARNPVDRALRDVHAIAAAFDAFHRYDASAGG